MKSALLDGFKIMKRYFLVSANIYKRFHSYETIGSNKKSNNIDSKIKGETMKKTTMYLMALALVGIMGVVGLASATGFGFFNGQNRTAIEQAINNNDYQAWKIAVTETLTPENFNKIVQVRNSTSDRTGRKTEHMSVMRSIKSGNYTAYIEAIDNTTYSGNALTEEEFNATVARYTTGVSGERFGHKRGFSRHGMHW